jgi:class 3 adenylate cyclase
LRVAGWLAVSEFVFESYDLGRIAMSLSNGAPNTYSAEEVASLCERIRERVKTLVVEHEELTIVADEFEQVLQCDPDPLREVWALFTACADVIIQLKHMLNPTGLPLHLTADGRVITQTFEGVTTFLTDIRGFTELTHSVTREWNISVFDVLSFCYFPHVTEVLETYGCHYLNYTGDGLLVLSRARLHDGGRVLLPSIDNAVICAIALTGVTNAIAATWKSLGLTMASGRWHETGLGLAYGDVQVGDPFVPYHNYRDKCADFNASFHKAIAEHAPYFQPRNDYSRRVRTIQALSTSINRASRLQDADKDAPDHTCMMISPDVARLCPPLQGYFECVGEAMLRGIGMVEICGIRRFANYDIPAIEAECLAYHAESVGS